MHAAVTKYEARLEELETDMQTQRENNSHRIRTSAGEGISVCESLDSPTRRKRPESDGLRQLKNQTEDNLDTFRKMGFIPTSQTEKAKKLLQEKRSIVIKGNPGEGKTSTALHLIDNNNYTDQRVVILRPKQWEKIDTDRVKIVVLEDIFGQYDLDTSRLQEWIDTYLQKIQNHVDEGKLQVIITIRDDIFSKAISKLKSFKFFHNDRLLTLCSDELQNADKNSILNRELTRNKKDMNLDEKEQCIDNFKGLIGFPQCCTLFARNENLFVPGPDFFRSPKKFLVDNIRNLKADSFLSLAFIFCNNEIEEEYLSPSQIKESKKYLPVLQDIAQCLKILFDESTMISLRQSYEHYSGLYVKKVPSCQDHSVENLPYVPHLRENVNKSCIQFSHATVYEAVGQVIGDSCPELVVKYGDSGYLYRKTYTAEAKDDDSQNVFTPVSVYGLLAERMVHDVVEKEIVWSVVKHSALKENVFLMKLKDELHKVNSIRDFFMADPYSLHRSLGPVSKDLSNGYCSTFLQCVLQHDEDAVKLVYSHFMEFLACIHNNKVHYCWQCEKKQTLLELALYYHHFEIADQLITMNARYTHVSLCNAARHDDLSRVLTILEDLKNRQVFNPECIEAKHTLCIAYLKENQDIIKILLQEGITLDRNHVVNVVLDGDIDMLMKVVEHLKLNKNWDPHFEDGIVCRVFHPPDIYSSQFKDSLNKMPCSEALYVAYCKERFDMVDYLLKNEAKVTLVMLPFVTEYSSQQSLARMIQDLKVTGIWDSHCDRASKALELAYSSNKHDVSDLLIHEGVSLTMKNLSGIINTPKVLLDSVEKVVQHLKDTHSWDLKCNDASKALQTAYMKNKVDVCDLLIQEGVSLTMKNFASITSSYGISLESVIKAIQHLKDTDGWDPICDEASNAFIKAYEKRKYDVCGLLFEEGVSCAFQYLPVVTLRSLDFVKIRVKQLKDTDSWDAKCHDTSKALEIAYSRNKHDVCLWLIQEGVSLTMKNLANVTRTYDVSLESVKKIIQHLKGIDCWDPKNVCASEALGNAYRVNRYDVCDLLIQEGVSVTMNTLLKVIKMFVSTESVKKIIQHLKGIDSWDPRCDDAYEALEVACENDDEFREYRFDVFDLLFQEGVSLKMKHLPYMIERSQDLVKRAVKQLKDTDSWDAKCDDASEALAKAYGQKQYDVCQLLIQEGVSLIMKNLPSVIISTLHIFQCTGELSHINTVRVSLEYFQSAIQHLKDANIWDNKCDDASEALGRAYREELYDVCQLLLQEGVSLTMKNLAGVISYQSFGESFKSVQKAIQHLKNTGNWDPKCNDAFRALEIAYMEYNYDLCDLLMQEGVSLTMKCLSYMPLRSVEYVKTAVKQLKDTNSWDAKCDDASKPLETAYREEKNDVCDLLIQEGVTLTMKNLPGVISFEGSQESVQKAVQHLKDNDSWNPKCDYASKALAKAYGIEQYDVCHLLIQEGVSLTMSNLTSIFSTFGLEVETAKKVIQHLKDTDSWDPKCDHAIKALEVAYAESLYDVYDLLLQEGVLHH